MTAVHGIPPAMHGPDPAIRLRQIEDTAIFRRTWQPIAQEESVVQSGSFVTATIAGQPVIVLRDGSRLRALANVCRHRGMQLCQGSGRADTLRCAYHGWRYGLDGSLRAVPQRAGQFPDLCLSDAGLDSFEVTTWAGLVFVRVQPASSLPAGPSALDSTLANHDLAELPVVVCHRILAACNWKLLVENHIDVYHLWHLHEDSLYAYDHTKFRSWWPATGVWQSWEPARHPPQATSGLPLVPALADASAGQGWGMGAHLLAPNVLVVTSPHWLAVYWLVPLAPDRTAVELVVRAPAGADPDTALADVLGFVNQDVWACEQIQVSMGNPQFAEGPLAVDLEAHIPVFRRLIAEAIDAAA